jgi:hypothetical protein
MGNAVAAFYFRSSVGRGRQDAPSSPLIQAQEKGAGEANQLGYLILFENNTINNHVGTCPGIIDSDWNAHFDS